MIPDEKIHAIALSFAASPVQKGIIGNLSMAPTVIYEELKAKDLTTQGFIAEVYPGTLLDAARAVYERALAGSVRIVDFWDGDYPSLLREIERPPLVLYVRGPYRDMKAVAVVGTRKADSRSSLAARRIAAELSAAGWAVVSGMAVGIDREAHLGALQAGGATIGVLANGIDVVYPWPNRDLYAAILASTGSFLISEYPPGIRADRWTFVRRNRIISGLARGTVVVKAGEKSGALITAGYALEQNREVFACPGPPFDEGFYGCHALIRSGAVPVSRTGDILRELPGGMVPALPAIRALEKAAAAFDPDSMEGRIMELLSQGEKDIDQIVRQFDTEAGAVNEAVVALELSGCIGRNGNILSRL